MKKMLLVAAAAALATASHAGPGASSVNTGAKAGAKPITNQAVLYDQNSDDNGVGIVSQNFEATFDTYDSQGADDFTVPAGSCWKITDVTVAGVYYNGSGPASSVNVTFYKNKSNLPSESKIIASFTGVVPTTDSSGSFVIKLPAAVKARPGKYWVSVQANLDLIVGGQWGWETRNTQAGTGGAWKNPGGGFGTGCSAYGNMLTCLDAQDQGPDYMFSLSGKSKAC